MAVQNLHKTTEISFEINLNETFLAKRRLRYLYHCEPNIVSTIPDKNKKCVPLFLGCDVVDECSYSSGNLPRFHAKHTRQGLATKVNFQSGVRIVGIHGTTRGVWFYSIQGLFKIAFEYYSREEQRSCLSKLRDNWERQILDPVLMSEINVVFENRAAENLPPCNVTLGSAKENVNSSTETMKTLNVDEFVNHVNTAIDSYINENQLSVKQYEVKQLKIYLSYINKTRDANSFVYRTIKLINACLNTLLALSKQLESLEHSEDTPSDDTTLVDYPMSSNSFGSAKPSDNSSDGANGNHNGAFKEDLVTLCKEAVLCEVADWLGREFLNYHDKIGEQVTLFKQGNINNIGNLPSAYCLVGEVFPKFMRSFFCTWMRVPFFSQESCETTLDEEGLQENRTNLYPVIQLILELANESLVSGVAHVLMSQLLQSDSVQ